MSDERPYDYPVIIVGGGGVGLSTAMFLSALNVESVLFERHPACANLPKAHVLNQRTMEIFREHGFAELVYEHGTPQDCMSKIAWYTSLGGDGEYDRRLIHSVDVRGGGKWKEIYDNDSPCRVANLPQLRLEPFLKEAVERQSFADVRFNWEVQDVSEETDCVAVRVLDRASGTTSTVRAAFVVVADGGKTVGPAMGITLQGPRNLADRISVHFSADLSDWVNDDGALSRWFIDPTPTDAGLVTGVIVPLGPKHWDRHSEEWVFHFGLPPGDPAITDDSIEAILPRMRSLMKIPALDIKIHRISHWLLEGVLADRYQVGRVLFAGDAVHRHPPTTGLGLNTGIQDAHNLAWKLHAVLSGFADRKLLESYELERRPVGRRNVDWAMMTSDGMFITESALGIVRGASERNRMVIEKFFADTYDGRARRKIVAEIFDGVAHREFCSHGLDLGFTYASDAVIADGSPEPTTTETGNDYTPTTRPGHRFPHFWLEHDGKRVSSLDLVGRGRFVLFAGHDAAGWIDAISADRVEHGYPLDIVQVDTEVDENVWPWTSLRGVSRSGAVLVRPDGHVAWRCRDASPPEAQRQFRKAMRGLLGRTQASSAVSENALASERLLTMSGA